MLARRKDEARAWSTAASTNSTAPLYVASQAGSIAYRSLLKKQGKTQTFPILDGEMKEWMLWMEQHLHAPQRCVREKIIIEKGIPSSSRSRCPNCLLDFVTHVVGYKAVLAKWSRGDFSERRSTIPAGPPSSTPTSNAPTPPSKPNRPTCCTALPGGSGAGCCTARRGKACEGRSVKVIGREPEPGKPGICRMASVNVSTP